VTTTPESNHPRLRPLSLGEILDVAVKICLSHWRTLLKAVLVVVVPVQIVGTLINADYTVDQFDFGSDSAQTPAETIDELNQYLGGLAVSGVLQILAVLLATAACFRAIAQAYLGEQTDWRSSLNYALRLAPALLLITLLNALGVLLGLLLFVLPGIWLYVAWAFATPVLLVEGLRGTVALKRSFRLVQGRWWRTFGVLLVGFILAAIISAVVEAVFLIGIVVGEDNDALVLVLSTIAGIIGLAVTTPFQAALLAVLYFDLRVRKEGFDLELLAREIGGTVQPGAAAPAVVTSPPVPPPEVIDRTGAPFWPPPPGWKPPAPAAPADAGDGTPVDGTRGDGAAATPPPAGGAPSPERSPSGGAPTEGPPAAPASGSPSAQPPADGTPAEGPPTPAEEEAPALPGVPGTNAPAADDAPRLPGIPGPKDPPEDEPPRLPGVPHG
jgi:glycerophosphoryl diester phosphodiesterase family protein